MFLVLNLKSFLLDYYIIYTISMNFLYIHYTYNGMESKFDLEVYRHIVAYINKVKKQNLFRDFLLHHMLNTKFLIHKQRNCNDMINNFDSLNHQNNHLNKDIKMKNLEPQLYALLWDQDTLYIHFLLHQNILYTIDDKKGKQDHYSTYFH